MRRESSLGSLLCERILRKPPRPYQLRCVREWKRTLADGWRGFGIFFEQRVGKTLPALACVLEVEVERLLIVTTKKGIRVWEKEKRESMPSDWAVETRIINYQRLIDKRYHRKLQRWLAGASSFVIVDEAHHIKRRGSKWSKRCRSLSKKADYRLALTGTVIAQGIQDAWAVFDFMDPRILGKWAITKREIDEDTGRPQIVVVGGFQHRYLIMDSFWRSKVVGYQNEDEFMEIFHEHSFRLTLREAQREMGLRPTIIRRTALRTTLPAVQQYSELEEELRTVVNRKRIEAPLAITLVNKLQQICGGFLIDEDKDVHSLGSWKLDLLTRALREVADTRCVVVICRYLHEIDAITARLRACKRTVKVIRGGTEFDPEEAIRETAIVLQIQSGVAIDLAVSDTVIYYSWNYSLIDQEQSRFRVLSLHTRRVRYIYLVAKGTIDETILEAVTRKKNLATLVYHRYRRA